ncbi:hypothetical protein HDU96_003711, partial [Phlyctochytrium bullatum]
ETEEVVRCKRKGCVSGYVLPGIALDDVEEDTVSHALFWELLEEDVPKCHMVMFIGTPLDGDPLMELLVNSIPPHVPRLLIDTELSGPFITKSPLIASPTSAPPTNGTFTPLQPQLSRPITPPSLSKSSSTGSLPSITPHPILIRHHAEDPGPASANSAGPFGGTGLAPHRAEIERGGNYRDVALVFSEAEGGLSRGVKELARACRWGWDWDVVADVGVKLKAE